jgi:Holliday junction resolvase RusA-like endonuclease
MVDSRQFEVLVTPFEPLSLRGGKGRRYQQKEALRDRIKAIVGEAELQRSREEFGNQLVKVSLVFYLYKASKNVTNTRWKKDVDNLTKPVLDVLQLHLDSQQTRPGLGLIRNDDYVCVLHAAKKLAAREKDEGIHILVTRVRDDEMLRMLEGRGTVTEVG